MTICEIKNSKSSVINTSSLLGIQSIIERPSYSDQNPSRKRFYTKFFKTRKEWNLYTYETIEHDCTQKSI